MLYTETDDPKRKVEQEALKRSRKDKQDKRRRTEVSDDEVAGIRSRIVPY